MALRLWLTTRIVAPGVADLAHALEALELEREVADGEDLVDEQHLGLDVDGHGEAEPHEHARRVELDRRVDEVLDLGERHDRVEALLELALATSRGSSR